MPICHTRYAYCLCTSVAPVVADNILFVAHEVTRITVPAPTRSNRRPATQQTALGTVRSTTNIVRAYHEDLACCLRAVCVLFVYCLCAVFGLCDVALVALLCADSLPLYRTTTRP